MPSPRQGTLHGLCSEQQRGELASRLRMARDAIERAFDELLSGGNVIPSYLATQLAHADRYLNQARMLLYVDHHTEVNHGQSRR
jgi:hypothetical protein